MAHRFSSLYAEYCYALFSRYLDTLFYKLADTRRKGIGDKISRVQRIQTEDMVLRAVQQMASAIVNIIMCGRKYGTRNMLKCINEDEFVAYKKGPDADLLFTKIKKIKEKIE